MRLDSFLGLFRSQPFGRLIPHVRHDRIPPFRFMQPLMSKTVTEASFKGRRVLAESLPEPETAIELSVEVPSADGSKVRELEIFLVGCYKAERKPEVRAFENHCPHAGGPLNLLPDAFFSPDKEHLLCTRHGARFEPESGLCVHGPCIGRRLNELPVTVCESSGKVTVSEDALEELCERGGGAYIERAADGTAESKVESRRRQIQRLRGKRTPSSRSIQS
mmetsp:Transcript_59052/g.128201  ORF Transcript_59052/g.128201 Transcript_59052/m.128201 type:complete len:220 (-) Transcript_59052:210-869(-)